MVSFRNLFTAAVALSVPIAAQLSPAQVVTNIRALTQKSLALQAPSKSLTLTNGALVVIGQGPVPVIVAGFADIVTTATTSIAQMQGMPPVPAGEQSDAIFEAFREFVRIHQALLNILIGKAGLFSTVPFIGAPVASVLRQVEGVVDTIAFMLIDTVQARASDLKSEAGALSGTLTVCIEKYQGIAGGLKAKRTLRFARREIAAAA